MSTHSNLRNQYVPARLFITGGRELKSVVSSLQQSVRREKNEALRTKLNDIKKSLTLTQRAVELASEKGASNWLTVIPIDEMGSEQGRVSRRSKDQI